MIGLLVAISLAQSAAPIDGTRAAGSIPRDSLSWRTDSFGQAVGVTLDCGQMPGQVSMIAPEGELPDPLRIETSPGALRILSVAGAPASAPREIASIQWSGARVTWSRMSTPIATHERALKALAQWMATRCFAVTLSDGQSLTLCAEPQQVDLAVPATGGATVTAALAAVPGGSRLMVLGAAPPPADGQVGEPGKLIELGRTDLAWRVSTDPQTILDIAVDATPPQVRLSVHTPSALWLAEAERECARIDMVMKDAPADQLAVLKPEWEAAHAKADALRARVRAERVSPTSAPVSVTLGDPATGRVFVRMALTIAPADAGGAPAQPGRPDASGGRSFGRAVQPRKGKASS